MLIREKILMSEFQVSKPKSGKARPWLWPIRFLNRLTQPIPAGLWLVNLFSQRLLDINNDVPWMVNFTSRVAGQISIGRNVWVSFAISGNCYIQGGNGVVIDDDTIFAPGVKIISANHSKSNLNMQEEAPPIHIGKRCWIGANAVILPGVNLGDDCIVGAGSVVRDSFSNGSIIVGVPAKSILINK
jgi:carbonic anhydrase/acetyltransferase-like protein (isoleucine patch superfamily)